MKTTQLLRTIKIGLVGFLCCTVFFGAQGGYAAVPLPQVIGPIPVTETSYPFNAAYYNNTALNLDQFGYVEEEYFISGYANVYDFDAAGTVIVRTPDAPYTTRILVRKPISPSKFSGTVIVELLHPAAGFDLDIQWQLCHEYFIPHGDVWVGITSKPVAVQALKNFDEERYAPLSWDNPLPLSQTCTDSSLPDDSTPATENGLIWDIMSQVGALLKQSPLSPSSLAHPLQGFQVERVLATGYAMAGFYLVTYINFIRPLPTAHLASRTAVYDGYLIGDGDTMAAPLNQCVEQFELGDERIKIRPRPEPVISVITQTLISLSMFVRRPDSDIPSDRYRRYEVPGASNISQRQIEFSPTDEDKKRTGVPLFSPLNCTQIAQHGLSDFPLEYIMNGAFANLEAWVQDPYGRTPPTADWITMGYNNCPVCPALDEHDNAIGGVRTPYLDVPIATYFEKSTPEGGICERMGYKVPLECKDLLNLNCICFAGFCFSCNRYVPKVEDAVEELVQDGFITAEDGERIISEAEAMQPQLPYRRLHCSPVSPTPREPGP